MRTLLLICAALLAACGSDHLTVRGTLAGDLQPDSAAVWAVGGAAPVRFTGAGFEIPELPRGGVELQLRLDDGEPARLELAGIEGGGELVLHGLWVDDETGLAFPARVEGVRRVLVNGVRFAPDDALPGEVKGEALLLAAADDGSALLVRPADEGLPDLRLLLTPATELVTPDGDPVEADQLAPGDSLQLDAERTGGYLVARRITVPRGSARRGDGDAGALRKEAGDDAPAPGAPLARGNGAGDAAGATLSAVGSAGAGRAAKPGKGRGRGREKGRGKP